jgi:hypothetical protein
MQIMDYFHNLWYDSVYFAVAFIWNLANLLTGGVIVAALWLWDKFVRTVPRAVWIGAVYFFLAVASFNVWREEYKKTQPGLKLAIGSYGFADDITERGSPVSAMVIPRRKGSIATVTATLRNLGAPTIADNWQLSLDVPGRGSATAVYPIGFRYPLPQTFTFEDEIIPFNKILYEQTMSPVTTGDKKDGFLVFFVDGLEKKDVAVAGTKFTLSCTDVSGNVIASPPVVFDPNKGGRTPNFLQ